MGVGGWGGCLVGWFVVVFGGWVGWLVVFVVFVVVVFRYK